MLTVFSFNEPAIACYKKVGFKEIGRRREAYFKNNKRYDRKIFAKFKKEKNRVNLNTATLINSNYWRIEGIKNIYEIFQEEITEKLDKDLSEFKIIKDSFFILI